MSVTNFGVGERGEGVRRETRDESGDVRPKDVRQVAAFSSRVSRLTTCPPPGPARQGRRAGPKGAASRPRAESTGIARAVDSSLERREVKPVTVVLVVSVVPRCHST